MQEVKNEYNEHYYTLSKTVFVTDYTDEIKDIILKFFHFKTMKDGTRAKILMHKDLKYLDYALKIKKIKYVILKPNLEFIEKQRD